jgi:PAS domain S-box-containing protein
MRRRVAELELSHAKLQAVVAAFDGLIYVCSSQYTVEYMNDKFIQRTGRNAVGEHCFKVIHDRDEVCPWCVHEEVLGGETVRFEVLSPKDNRWYYVVNSPLRGPDGSISKMTMFQDITDLKRTEKALERIKERFEALLNATTEMAFLLDSRGNFLALNRPTAQRLGKEIPELLGRNAFSLFSPEVASERKAQLDLVLQTGAAVRFEDERLGRFFDTTCYPVVGKDGTVDSIAVFISDATERRRAQAALRRLNQELEQRVEERTAELRKINQDLVLEIAVRERTERELRQSEAKYRTLVDQIPAITYIAEADQAKTKIYISPQVETILGLSQADIQADPELWRRRLHPEDRDRVVGDVAGSYASGDPFISEYRMIAADGRVIWFRDQAVLVSDAAGRPVFSHGIMLDVTTLKQTEEALRQSEERFRTIFECAQDYIFLKNRELRYIYVNPALEKLLDLPASEIIGKSYEDLLGREGSDYINDVDLRVLAGQVIEHEYTRNIKGVPMTFHEVRVPMANSSGEIDAICGISRDITRRKKPDLISQTTIEHYPSTVMRATLKAAHYAAAGEGIVLLLGESGSGKDYLARWIHDRSRRCNGPFFAINCAAISKELAESELFGHEPGAFTGARGSKRGLLELAEGGTLLLNEIGELSLSLQSKLLAFLDTKTFVRVGGQKAMHINARIVAATNRNLETDIAEGRFLDALFYRLNVFAIAVPPLRERIEDLPILLEELMARLAGELQLTEIPEIDPGDVIILARYNWPGNVRELRNVLERALMLWDGEQLRVTLPSIDMTAEDWCYKVRFPHGGALRKVTRALTQSLCTEALRRCRGNKTAAARLLGISRDSLYQYLRRYRIAVGSSRGSL